ncbi:Alpha/Beta hydrolase protein [Corynascus similis CBS 632.67]
MAILKWITGLLLAGFLQVVSCGDTSRLAIVPVTSLDATGSADLASQFVSELIANATLVCEPKQDQQAHDKRSASSKQDGGSLVVDLGYAKYRGHHNNTTGLNYWKGIRFAAPPTGELRWKPPQTLPPRPDAPIENATAFGPICPQSLPSVPGAVFIPGNEDCLFLNVYGPPNAANLPVLVWIHGGGYGYGDGTQDMSEIINANDQGFVAVSIQYRLGAFGWLSSGELKEKGVVNAGILDQAFALAWIKRHICQFGGDPSRVTISGESAGGGSVMYHAIAVKGSLGTRLFSQGIAASPYLPFQYNYDDALPTERYYAFSQAAGCPDTGDVLDCLVGKDTDTLQQASFNVTQSSPYGYWGFWPVTDGSYIQNRPSQQLPTKKVNGGNLLVGHNANEGPLFVPPTITTEADLVGWLSGVEFPNLSEEEIGTVLAANPNDAPTDPEAPRFETDGLSDAPATAVHVSQDANGQQQRANNIYAEAVFACPAYWLASAYSSSPSSNSSSSDDGHRAWLYQYSVPFASHQADVPAYFGPCTPNQGADFVRAFARIWGGFVVRGDPSSGGGGDGEEVIPSWPIWTEEEDGFRFLNLNQTGGVPYEAQTQWGTTVTQFTDPGLQNDFSVASATTWEGGRKARCDVYLGLAESIPL